jgi:hypothetical protein
VTINIIPKERFTFTYTEYVLDMLCMYNNLNCAGTDDSEILLSVKRKSCSITGLERPFGLLEFEAPVQTTILYNLFYSLFIGHYVP